MYISIVTITEMPVGSYTGRLIPLCRCTLWHRGFFVIQINRGGYLLTDRPYKDYDKLLDKLKCRGLEIDNDEYAIEMLKARSYYGLINAFKNEVTYRDVSGKERFNEGVTFRGIVTEYWIENELKSLLLKYSLLAEIRLKEAVSHQLAKSFGENLETYLDRSHFNNRTGRRNSILGNIKRTARNTHDNPTYYYRNSHDTIPPWILLPNLTFGQFKKLYNILKSEQKSKVVKSILYIPDDRDVDQISESFVGDGISVLVDFRNTLAHGSRLLQYKSGTTIAFNTIKQIFGTNFLSEEEYQNDEIGGNDLFCLIYTIFKFCGNIDSEMFKIEIENLFNSFSNTPGIKDQFKIYYHAAGLPQNLSEKFKLLQK